MEKVVSGGVTEYKHFIHVNGESLALYSRKSTGTNATYYRHDDPLGSTEHLTDNAGANVVMPVVAMIGYFSVFPFSEDRTPTVLEVVLIGTGILSALFYVTWQLTGGADRIQRAFRKRK